MPSLPPPISHPLNLSTNLLLLLALTPLGAVTLGPFTPNPAVALYVVGDGQPCEARVRVSQGARPDPRWLLRVLDPSEQEAVWRVAEPLPEVLRVGLELPEGVTAPAAIGAGAAGDVLYETPVALSAAGVHQVRLANGSTGATLTLELSRELAWGVSFQNGIWSDWPDRPATLHAWVPPHAEVLELQDGPVTVTADGGAALGGSPARGQATVAVPRTDAVWRVDWPTGTTFRAAGFPLLLCPSPEAARALRASVIVLDDGTVVCHDVQRRIAQVLPEVLAKVGDADELVVPLSTRREAWLAEPERSMVLRESYLPAVEHWLRSQNTDPASHWSGSLEGWQERVGKPAPENRWDRLRSVPGLWAGASAHHGNAPWMLALAATVDHPTNPWFGREELLYRAAASALRDLMALGEDESWRGVGADLDPYPGMMAFPVAQKTFPVYAVAAPRMPEPVRAVWTEALRRIVDRHFSDYLVSARNQSSHWLVALHALAAGSGDPRDRALAQLFVRRWAAGQHPAGWHEEATGPDASYIGMTHWHEAVAYRLGGDPLLLDTLQRGYRFFNHTVAPESDGRMLGGFNFNHRVGEGFYFEQWGGAKGIVDDRVPEVGVWAPPEPAEEERAKHRATLEAFLANPKLPPYADNTTPRWLWWAEPDRSATFPALEAQPFVRNLSDQLIAVKRPGYYATIFVGHPAAGEFYIRAREGFRLATEGESAGGGFNMRKITPYLGGGLTGFWTPGYGHAVMAACWAPTTHHGLIATQPDGKRYWEDYYAHTFRLDEAAGELVIEGKVEGVPLAYTRTYTFGDQALGVRLALRAEQPVRLARLVENVPYARGGWKARGADLTAGGQGEGDVTASEARLADREGQGVTVALDHDRPLRLVPNGLQTEGWRQLQIGRLEIELPRELAAGETAELRYELRAR